MHVFKVFKELDKTGLLLASSIVTPPTIYTPGEEWSDPDAPAFAFSSIVYARAFALPAAHEVWLCEAPEVHQVERVIAPQLIHAIPRNDLVAWWRDLRHDMATTPVPFGTLVCPTITPIKDVT